MPVALPAPGCTTRPDGLSIDDEVVVGVRRPGTRCRARAPGPRPAASRSTSTSTTSPSTRRADRLVATVAVAPDQPGVEPARRPAVRLAPVTMATTRSMRSPSRGPGTVSTTPMSARRSSRSADGRSAPSASSAASGDAPSAPSSASSSGTGRKLLTTSRIAPTTTPMSATLKTGHHWRSMKSTTEPPEEAAVAGPEGAVDHVAERTADDQAEGHRAEAGAHGEALPDQQGHDERPPPAAIQRPQPSPMRERGAGVVGEVEAQGPDDVDVAAAEVAHAPSSWRAGRAAARRRRRRRRAPGGCLAGARDGWGVGGGRGHGRGTRCRAQRRPNPPTLYSTRSRAHGIALRRSFGIGVPDTSQMP